MSSGKQTSAGIYRKIHKLSHSLWQKCRWRSSQTSYSWLIIQRVCLFRAGMPILTLIWHLGRGGAKQRWRSMATLHRCNFPRKRNVEESEKISTLPKGSMAYGYEFFMTMCIPYRESGAVNVRQKADYYCSCMVGSLSTFFRPALKWI